MTGSATDHDIRPAAPRRIVLAGMEHCAQCFVCEVRDRSVCNAIDDADLHHLAHAATRTTIAAGQEFIEEGAPAREFFNITGGTVKLFKSLPDGRRQITGFAGVGHSLGLAVSDCYAFGAEAIDQVRICRFPRAKMEKLLVDFPRLERRLLAEAANELVTAQDQMLLLGRKTARERVASFLLGRLSEHLPGHDASSMTVTLPMTRSDIADFLGLTIETVSRTFSWLRGQKLIETASPHKVTVLALARLTALAEGEG